MVTGGNRGLGRAMAVALGEAGAQVALTSRTQGAADAAAEELRASGMTAFGVQLEVTDAADVERAVERIGEDLGPIDILLNNAGISVAHTALDAADDDWSSIMATNVDGVWHCSRAVGRRMVERGSGGTIVNIGSMSAQIVNQPRWQPAYLASKGAVHQLTKGLAAE